MLRQSDPMPRRCLPSSTLLLVAVGCFAAPARAAGDLDWKPFPGGGVIASVTPRPGRPGFTELTASELGIFWTNRLSPARYATRQNLMNGAGLAFADIDGDDRCDVFFANKEGASALYRNLGGWRFTNVTAQAGVESSHLMSSGALFADFNGDRRPDLFVTSFLGPDALYLNLGDGRFTNVTVAAGVASKGGTTSAAVSDVDGDGDLDLYVCHFGIEAIVRDGAAIVTRNVGGKPVVTGRFARRLRIVEGRMIELGEPDVLFLNDGKGTFRPAPPDVFVDADGQPLGEMPPDFGLAVQIRDFNLDGHPDIYLCNDFNTPDRLWYGDGRGRFRAPPRNAFRNMSYASMGVDAADLDRDGHFEIFTVEMLSREHVRHLSQMSPVEPRPKRPGQAEERCDFARNVLQWNRGDGTFAEIAWFAGVAMSDWSWTPIFLDVDLDGFEDLLVSNGHMHDVNDMDLNATRSTDPVQRARESVQQILLRYPRLLTPKAAWRNRGDLTFEDAGTTWGFDSTHITHGLALADLDNDGDADVVGNAFDHSPLVYRNDSPAPRLAIRLRGPEANPDGIGARIRVRGGAVPLQQQEILAGGRYLSCDQPQLYFAAGQARALDVEVLWPDGRQSLLRAVPPNSILRVDASHAAPPPASATSAPPLASPPPLLTPLPADGLPRHEESDSDDFARQPGLPRRLGQLGPKLAAAPSGDALEIFLGAGRGGRLQGVRCTSDGTITPLPPLDSTPLPDDATGLLAVQLSPGVQSLFVGLSHLESRNPALPGVLRYDRPLSGGPWRSGPSLPRTDESDPGTLLSADLDGDALPDLIVAGRHIPGRYPEPASTRVFRNDPRQPGQLIPDDGFSAPLGRVGLVTGAAVLDFDADGKPDLALACEWGAIRLFRNTGRTFIEQTEPAGLAPHTGLWQSLAAGDFDGDGRPDLVAGNWGRNSHHQRCPRGPWELWYGDFAGLDHPALIEASFDPALRTVVPFRHRDTLAKDLGWLSATFPKHQDFARASVEQILGSHAASAKALRATTLDSTLFLNRGGRFEAVPLPGPAQWSPVSALAVGDLNADGRPDLVATQNLFAVRDEDDRMDAGLGLVLLNEGAGRFRALPAAHSGLHVLGEQTSVLVIAQGSNRPPIVALAENAGPLHLFRVSR